MGKSFKLSIQNPCNAEWQKMASADNGRFCESCQKQVVDFTNLSGSQIKSFINNNNKGKVCGRFESHQLKNYYSTTPSLYLRLLTLLGLALVIHPAKSQINSDTVNIQRSVKENAPVIENNSLEADTLNKYSITGVILDEQLKPLPGVSIHVQGTQKGTVSNAAGEFKIILEEQPVTATHLLISFIGYERISRKVEFNETVLADLGNITMTLDIHSLMGEVVVVNYNPIKGLWWRIKNLFR